MRPWIWLTGLLAGCETIPPSSPCGNGALDEGEQCDDGNRRAGDGCAPACVLETSCGNGILDPAEECDDGNLVNGDGCASSCFLEGPKTGICGNGVVELGEECDDGNGDADDGCSPECTLEWVCGDGDLDPGEECDDGNTEPLDGCGPHCLYADCGNGKVEDGEMCDDGNAIWNDACTNRCQDYAACHACTLERCSPNVDGLPVYEMCGVGPLDSDSGKVVADPVHAERCLDLSECMHDTGCAWVSRPPEIDMLACLVATPVSPCADLWWDAAYSEEGAGGNVLWRHTDPAYPVGAARLLAECQVRECVLECAPPE